MFTDDIHGEGMIVIDGEIVETVYYWLTIVPRVGLVIAEGSISGSEQILRKIKHAKTAKLTLVDGPTVALRCQGGKNGTRWVKVLRGIAPMKDFANASFPPDVISLMKNAMDAAVSTLPEPVSSTHVQAIAETILRTAKEGERNPVALQRLALLELQIKPRDG